ncbi:MAG TPA: magnesium transporter CorA family protein [Acidimicrobiales bacterium]|nr:magnesium transporter CorA family protein [Acidimicrobiales bacterium]
MSRTRAYRKGTLEEQDFPVSLVSEHLDVPDTIVWVDLCDPSPDELHELASELGLHELAVEDALESHQRPKLDHYPTHLFLSSHMVEMHEGMLTVHEIDTFVNPRWLITVRKSDACDIRSIVDHWDRSPDLAVYGVAYLLYGLLDTVADTYFDVVGGFDEYYEEVSTQLFEDHPIDPAGQRDRFQMRQSLVKVYRLVTGLREAVGSLLRREQGLVPTALDPYYQDVYDHLLRASESIDTLRELASSIVETNLALRDFRQNQIVKQVTSWAAIVAVPTLITGYYGMNVRYPGINTTWGWIASVLVMLGCSLGLFALFRRKGWL